MQGDLTSPGLLTLTQEFMPYVRDLTVKETFRAEYEELHKRSQRILRADLSCDGILEWWKKSQHVSPRLARFARVIFGAPPSPALQELYFSDTGK